MTERSRGIAVAGAHRTVRRLAEGEGPFAGELVTRGDGVAVRADIAQLAGWPGWRFAGAEHVAAPEDLALRPDGQDVLLPWCVRSAEGYLAQRAAEGPLGNGEAVTLAVSILRGLIELGSLEGGEDDGPAGRWWLTDQGRPAFAIGSGDPPLTASGSLLDALEARTDDRALGRVLRRLGAALEEPRRLRAEAARWEQELLEIAAPRALRLPAEDSPVRAVAASPPERARALRRRDLRAGAGAPSANRREGRRGAAREAASARGDVRRLVSRPLLAVRSLFRDRALMRRWGDLRRRPLRRADQKPGQAGSAVRKRRWMGPAIVAVTAAGAVAVLGAVWPAGAGTPPADAADLHPALSASPPPVSASASPRAPRDSPLPEPGRTAGPARSRDPLAAATELIDAARACRRSPAPACTSLWDAGGSAGREVRGGEAAPVLIEDYGDIAAVRNAGDGGAQMIVIIRRDDGWRIRDVYDVADPPSEGAEAR